MRSTLTTMEPKGIQDRRWRILVVWLMAILPRTTSVGAQVVSPTTQFKPKLEITNVIPKDAPSGAKVTLILSRPLDVTRDKVTVDFGGVEAKILSLSNNVIYVTVPNGLDPGDSPPINVASAGSPLSSALSASYLGFKVEASAQTANQMASTDLGGSRPPVTQTAALPAIEIRRMDPPSAPPGSTIKLYLSRPDSMSSVSVFFDSTKVPSTVDGNGTVVSVQIPWDMRTGEITLSVIGADVGIVTSYTITERKIFGVRQSSLFRVAVVLLILAPLVFGGYYSWRGRNRLKQLTRQYNAVRSGGVVSPYSDGSPDPDLPTSVPEPSSDLIATCASGNCVLFAGPGVAAQSLLPTRYEALLHLIELAEMEPRLKQQLRDALRSGQFGFVTEILGSRIDRETIIAELQVLYADDGVDLSEAHALLQRMPFAGILTTGWDGLIEKTFARRQPVVITGETDVGLVQRQDAFYIARLNGDLYVSGSFIFSAEEYRQTLHARPGYARFVSSQVFAHSLFFVGMSLSGIEEFFDAFRTPQRAASGRNSYAIVPYAPLWDAQTERFRTKYGVELIGYPPSDSHAELVTFLRKLDLAVKAEKLPLKAADFSDAKLRRVKLTNIGAFDSLTIDDLQSGWNILLGNNGSGKSTILRAVALGLCGEDPAAALAAGRLLRQGERAGQIELQVGDLTYVTDLQRDGDRTTLISPQSPIQTGNWVVLGFPPLRGVSMRDPIGPTPFGATEPRVTDLLPLVRGTIDTRLDSMKQWLVNLDVNKTPVGNISRADAQHYGRIIQSFYQILPLFTPGQSISEGHVDRSNWQVYVKTDDGEVPIDNISQGMSSIFGWVGTLLQRMYEIYRDVDDPTQQPALVLVDEIDAHLHPEWQQVLTTIVKKHFPNVQVLATTHSPLLVAGMRQDELFIARRDPADAKHIDVFRSPIDPEGLRADQILTSPIFGLMTTRGPKTNAEIKRYSILFGKPKDKRSSDEETELLGLQEKLSGILSLGETAAEREAERSRRESVAAQFANIVNEAAEASDAAKAELRRRLAPSSDEKP
jgi:energy-coupling factor transporter ATP-binding protein EcfA2